MGELETSEHRDLADDQNKLLGLFFFISVFFHAGVAVVSEWSLLWKPHPVAEEWVIESELIIDTGSELAGKNAMPRLDEKGELTVPSNLLPQLPKRFRIDKASEKRGIEQQAKKLKEEAAEDKKGGKTEELDDKSIKKLSEQEALKRKALEQLAAQQEKQSKKYMAPDKEALKRLKNELDKKNAKSSSGFGLASEQGKWMRAVEKAVRGNYYLPKTFRAKKHDLFTILAVKVNGRGDLLEVKVHESSDDPIFDAFAVTTMKNTAPYSKPPAFLIGQTVLFKFNL